MRKDSQEQRNDSQEYFPPSCGIIKNELLSQTSKAQDSSGQIGIPSRPSQASKQESRQASRQAQASKPTQENLPGLDGPIPDTGKTKISLPKDLRKNCPYKEIVDLYHTTLPELPRIRILSEKTKANMRKLWLFVLDDSNNDTHEKAINDIRTFFVKHVKTSDFLMGRSERSEAHANWRPNLDWLMKPENVAKISNGNFVNPAPVRTKPKITY